MQGVLTSAIALWRFGSPPGLQLPQWELTWECESAFSHSLTLSPKARVTTNNINIQWKMDFVIYVIFGSYFIKNVSFFIRKLKIFPTKIGQVKLSNVTTLMIRIFGKIEAYDGLYNCLLCVIIVLFFQSLAHIQKNFFHDQH
jgi:hypothetical protein